MHGFTGPFSGQAGVGVDCAVPLLDNNGWDASLDELFSEGPLLRVPEGPFNVHAKHKELFNKLYVTSRDQVQRYLMTFANGAGRSWNGNKFAETLLMYRYDATEFRHLMIFEPSKFMHMQSHVLDGMVSKLSFPLLFSWMVAWYASSFHAQIASIPKIAKFSGVARVSYFSASNFEHVFNAFQSIPFTLDQLRSTFQQSCLDLTLFKDILVANSMDYGSFRSCIWEPRFLLLFFRDVNPILDRLAVLHNIFHTSVAADL